MQPGTNSRRRRRRGTRPEGAALAIAACLLAAGLAVGSGRPGRPAPGMAEQAQDVGLDDWAGQYDISAHLFLLGHLGDVGTMTVESARRAEGGRLEKSLRMAGSANAEQVKKNRDYSGEFILRKVLPLRADGRVDEDAVLEWRDVESSSSGFLKLNKKFQSEKIAFLADHAVSTREDGREKRIEGSYGCILSPLEYLMDHSLKVGEVFETPFLLNGIPRVFRCEVNDLVTLTSYRARAYQVDIWAVEKTAGVDKAPKDVWRKKGNVRIWFCKDGPLRNKMLRMKIRFRWYLWLYFDLQEGLRS